MHFRNGNFLAPGLGLVWLAPSHMLLLPFLLLVLPEEPGGVLLDFGFVWRFRYANLFANFSFVRMDVDLFVNLLFGFNLWVWVLLLQNRPLFVRQWWRVLLHFVFVGYKPLQPVPELASSNVLFCLHDFRGCFIFVDSVKKRDLCETYELVVLGIHSIEGYLQHLGHGSFAVARVAPLVLGRFLSVYGLVAVVLAIHWIPLRLMLHVFNSFFGTLWVRHAPVLVVRGHAHQVVLRRSVW